MSALERGGQEACVTVTQFCGGMYVSDGGGCAVEVLSMIDLQLIHIIQATRRLPDAYF